VLTEGQYITFILGFAATIATVLIALLINNARLTDVKEALRAEIAAVRADTRSEVAASQQAIVSHLLDLINKIAELDSRITRLER
jgi:hypothetical protein